MPDKLKPNITEGFAKLYSLLNDVAWKYKVDGDERIYTAFRSYIDTEITCLDKANKQDADANYSWLRKNSRKRTALPLCCATLSQSLAIASDEMIEQLTICKVDDIVMEGIKNSFKNRQNILKENGIYNK